MAVHTTRKDCRKEAAKYTPIIAEVQICDIPENFPKSCKTMIGKTYSAIMHTDSRGKIWYNILKDIVFGEQEEFEVALSSREEFIKKECLKVSFENRKYIRLQSKYCY